MFHLISFSGRWDPAFFDKEPLPQDTGESAEESKKKTHAASEARARLRLAKKYLYHLERGDCTWMSLYPHEQKLVQKLKNGILQSEANRLTIQSGHGRITRKDGTIVDIGGSTGGFVRAELYNYRPPDLDLELKNL